MLFSAKKSKGRLGNPNLGSMTKKFTGHGLYYIIIYHSFPLMKVKVYSLAKVFYS